MKQNPAIKAYLKEFSAALPCPRGLKRVFQQELNQRLATFDTAGCTMDLLCEEMGTPQEVAESILRSENIQLLKVHNQLLERAAVALSVVTCLAVICLVGVILLLIDRGGVQFLIVSLR